MSHSFIQNNFKFHIIKDEKLVSKTEGKTTFLRHLKQFNGLTRLTMTPVFYDRSTPLTIVQCESAAVNHRVSALPIHCVLVAVCVCGLLCSLCVVISVYAPVQTVHVAGSAAAVI